MSAGFAICSSLHVITFLLASLGYSWEYFSFSQFWQILTKHAHLETKPIIWGLSSPGWDGASAKTCELWLDVVIQRNALKWIACVLCLAVSWGEARDERSPGETEGKRAAERCELKVDVEWKQTWTDSRGECLSKVGATGIITQTLCRRATKDCRPHVDR